MCQVDLACAGRSIAESSASGEVSHLTPEEAAAAFDRVARIALELSGEEFRAALDEGKYDDVDPDARGCSRCSWRCFSYADAPCRQRRRIKRSKRS